MSTPNLLDAIRVVKENERIAKDSYADAANKLQNHVGRELFIQLSEFEKYHYEKLTALENSLVEKGDYIKYKGKAFPLPPIFEINIAKDPNQVSIIEMILPAIELERQAEKAYADLANQIKDREGHKMFSRLSEEEHKHYRILKEAYWALTNLRVWKFSRQG